MSSGFQYPWLTVQQWKRTTKTNNETGLLKDTGLRRATCLSLLYQFMGARQRHLTARVRTVNTMGTQTYHYGGQ